MALRQQIVQYVTAGVRNAVRRTNLTPPRKSAFVDIFNGGFSSKKDPGNYPCSYYCGTYKQQLKIIQHINASQCKEPARDPPDNEWLDDPDLYEQKDFQRGFLHGLAPAGRLDIDSTGILVLTQDGRVARHLIGEDSSVEKEYLVRVEGTLSDADLKRLNHGLSLDGEQLKPAKVSWQNEDQLRFVLREGKKRQIRRMCEMVGLFVVGLKRVRIGSVNLGKLPQGQWRYLRNNEQF